MVKPSFSHGFAGGLISAKKNILSPWCLVLSCSTYKGEIMYTTKWFLQWNVFWFSSTPWTLYIFYNVAPLVISWFINPMNILVIQPSLWELCHLCSPTNRNFVATGAPLCTYCLFSYSSYIYIYRHTYIYIVAVLYTHILSTLNRRFPIDSLMSWSIRGSNACLPSDGWICSPWWPGPGLCR